MKKKKMLIVSGGSIQDRFASAFLNMQACAEEPPVLIAADRGLDHLLRLGILPDLVIGDFDSVSEEGKRFLASAGEEKIVRLRPEKDETDTESALRLAVSRGAGEVTILGVTGTRLDHVLAGLALTAVGEELGCRVTLLDQHNIVRAVGSGTTLRKREIPGKYISFFAIKSPVTGLTLTGFRYPLRDYTLDTAGIALTVSNEIKEETAVVKYDSGLLVMIISDDEGLRIG